MKKLISTFLAITLCLSVLAALPTAAHAEEPEPTPIVNTDPIEPVEPTDPTSPIAPQEILPDGENDHS